MSAQLNIDTSFLLPRKQQRILVERTLAEGETGSAGVFKSKVQTVENGKYILVNGEQAVQAFSCLVVPEQGDTVLVCRVSERDQREAKLLPEDNMETAASELDVVIISILSRVNPIVQVLKTEGVNTLVLQAPTVRLLAKQRLQAVAGKAIELVSGAGGITQQAKNITLNAAGNLISVAKRCISKSEHCSVDAKDILTIKGGHSLIEAECEMRLNAKHINMG